MEGSDFLFNIHPNTRSPKNGWYSGYYNQYCGNCGKDFVGGEGCQVCSHCAYTFSEQLEYERLWRDVGWEYTFDYISSKLNKENKECNLRY